MPPATFCWDHRIWCYFTFHLLRDSAGWQPSACTHAGRLALLPKLSPGFDAPSNSACLRVNLKTLSLPVTRLLTLGKLSLCLRKADTNSATHAATPQREPITGRATGCRETQEQCVSPWSLQKPIHFSAVNSKMLLWLLQAVMVSTNNLYIWSGMILGGN